MSSGGIKRVLADGNSVVEKRDEGDLLEWLYEHHLPVINIKLYVYPAWGWKYKMKICNNKIFVLAIYVMFAWGVGYLQGWLQKLDIT